jgi:hypothetical protein
MVTEEDEGDMTATSGQGKARRRMAVAARATMFLVFGAALFLHPGQTALGKEQPKPAQQDAMKIRLEREKEFLLRAVDDQESSLAFVKETMELIKERVNAEETPGPDGQSDERRDFLEWYQKYADWLKGMADEIETDVDEHFSRKGPTTAWISRYDELASGYAGFAQQLSRRVGKLDDGRKKLDVRVQKLGVAVRDRRVLVSKDDLDLAKELWPTYRDRPYGPREAVYKDLTDDEVERLRGELRALGETQTYYEVLAELARYELGWISLKAEDSAALSAVARAIGDDARDPIKDASRRAIRTYESDRELLRRESAELDGKLRGITRTGSLKTLELNEELAGYYEKMKTRYERQFDWLRGQIGGYQADLVELAREP